MAMWGEGGQKSRRICDQTEHHKLAGTEGAHALCHHLNKQDWHAAQSYAAEKDYLDCNVEKKKGWGA